jgi:hypothetical protein
MDKSVAQRDMWNIFGTDVPECQIKYFSQVILMFIVITYSVVALIMYKDECNSVVWGALLGNAVGALIPTTKLYEVASWTCFGLNISSRQIIYMLQIIMVYGLSITSLTCLMFDIGSKSFWASTAGTCLGFIMPNPIVAKIHKVSHIITA